MKMSVAAAVLGALALLPSGKALAQAQASPYTTGTRYDAVGRVTGTISADPDGTGPRTYLAVRNTYDASGRLVRVESGSLAAWQSESVAPASWTGFTAAQTTDTQYDAMGRKLRDTVSAGGAVQSLTQYSYDGSGRLDCTAVRMSAATIASPPPSACTPDAGLADRITRNSYDAADQLRSVRRAYGTPLEQIYVAYEYGGNGQRTRVTDANGNRADLLYDGHDRQTRWVFPSRTVAGQVNEADYEAYEYDANGNRTTLRKRDGRTLAYQYDALNRMTVKTVPQSATGAAGYSVHYGYDLRSLQTYARFGSSTGPGVSNSYDALGRLATTTTNMDGTPRTIASSYDAQGNRTFLQASSGHTLLYTYDVTGRMTALQHAGPSTMVTLEYDQFGRRSRLRYGTGGGSDSIVDYGYDPASRLASLSRDLAGSGADQTLGFGYNPGSQIVTRSNSNNAYTTNTAYGVDRSYAVNGLNQYTEAGPVRFCYDRNGNLSTDGATSISYDGEGNPTCQGATTFVYDAENRLTSASGARNATLSYDPMGRLWQVSGPSGTTRFVYDGDDLLEEYDASGTRLRGYAHGAGADEPLVWYELTGSPVQRFLHADHQGSIVAGADTGANALFVNAYDSWGIPNPANEGRFGYTGQTWIPELGMWHYKARIYSPTLGRFLQTDPTGYEDQANLYAYVGNDPVNTTDPDGEEGRSFFERYVAPVLGFVAPGARTATAAAGLGRSTAAGGAVAGGPVAAVTAIGVTGAGAALVGSYRGYEAHVRTTYGSGRPSFSTPAPPRDQGRFVVRVQVQGTDLRRESYVPIERSRPVTVGEVHDALREVVEPLTGRERSRAQPGIDAAGRWADGVAAAGGTTPTTRTFRVAPDVRRSRFRVDIEVKEGRVNIVR